MSNSTLVERDSVVANMASLTVHEADHTPTDDFQATTSTTTDFQSYAQHKEHMVTDTESTDTQSNDAAHPASSSSSDKTDLSKSSPDTSAKISPDTAGNMNPDAEAACTTVQSTAPIPVVYPPRRPNIFRTRQKHLRFPTSMYGRGPVRPDAVDATTQELEAADGFSVADLEEFQAEIREKMKKKSEMFVKMVRQSAWEGRRVEDLGEVFEIEN